MIIDFSKYSSVKIGPKLEVSVINEISDTKSYIIGGANNLLISPKEHDIAVLGDNFDYIRLENNLLHIGAKTSARKIFKFAFEHDIKGFELCASVPGMLGGLLKMNAGLKGRSISDYLVALTSSSGMLQKKDCAFEYRKSRVPGVIFGASFFVEKGFDNALLREFESARKNQPKGASFGSVFKNPQNDSAGRLIEAVGLKGAKIGNCQFSSLHANFLINLGGGTFDDALTLINLAKSKVKSHFGIELEEEVIII